MVPSPVAKSELPSVSAKKAVNIHWLEFFQNLKSMCLLDSKSYYALAYLSEVKKEAKIGLFEKNVALFIVNQKKAFCHCQKSQRSHKLLN